MAELPEVEIFTDGACKGNPGPGGWGAWLASAGMDVNAARAGPNGGDLVRLNNGQNILISKTLKQVEDLLNMEPFFRVHNSFLVNLQYAIRYVKGEGGYLVLNNDMTVPVARSKKDELLKLITHLSV